MTVGELKSLLDSYDDSLEVVTSERRNYARYAYTFSRAVFTELEPFYGKNERVVCLIDNNQIGVVD